MDIMFNDNSMLKGNVDIIGVIMLDSINGMDADQATAGKGWYYVCMHADTYRMDGIVYFDGTNFNGLLKGFSYYEKKSFIGYAFIKNNSLTTKTQSGNNLFYTTTTS